MSPLTRRWINEWDVVGTRRRSYWRRLTPPQLFAGSFASLILFVPECWIGRTVRELALPRRFRISIVALHDVLQDAMVPVPAPDTRLKESDTLLVSGKDEDLARAPRVK